MGLVDQQGSKFFRNCFPPASFQQYLTRQSFNTGSPSLRFSKRLQLRDHRKSGQGSFVSAKYLSSDTPCSLCQSVVWARSRVTRRSRCNIHFYRVAVFLPWSQRQNASAPSCSACCSISRHRRTKFLQYISLAIHPTVYFEAIHPHLYMCVRFIANFFVYFCFKKNYVQKQSVYREKNKKGKCHKRKWAWGFTNIKVKFCSLFLGCSCKILELREQQCSDCNLSWQRSWQQKLGPLPSLFT